MDHTSALWWIDKEQLMRRCLSVQMSLEQLGYIPGPILPMNVTGEMDLTQGMTGPRDNGTAATRGYVVVPSGTPYFSNASQVRLRCGLEQDTLICTQLARTYVPWPLCPGPPPA